MVNEADGTHATDAPRLSRKDTLDEAGEVPQPPAKITRHGGREDRTWLGSLYDYPEML